MPLIARAPMRISFGGGGTDLEAYYSKYEGLVVSAAIDKYFYAVISENGSRSLQLISANYGTFHSQERVQDLVWDGNLALPKAVVDHFGLPIGHDVFMASEIPPGTGLGSSSAAAVCLCLALATKQGMQLSRKTLAEMASRLEIEKLGLPIGKQDQYASAFGGINVITFTRKGATVEPVNLPPERVRALERNLMLFFMGSSRSSSTILRQQRESTRRGDRVVLESLHAIKEMALEMRQALEQGDLPAMGTLLDLAWQRKKLLASTVTTPEIDEWYRVAKDAGALGGKVTGAGGGGFLLLYCPAERQAEVARRLHASGLHQMRFQFDFLGAHILLNSGGAGTGLSGMGSEQRILNRGPPRTQNPALSTSVGASGMADVFQTIVVAVSGTEISQAAAVMSLCLARIHGARVVMVNVMDTGLAEEIARVMGRPEGQVVAEMERSGHAILRHAEVMARREGVAVETVIRRGTPQLEIVAEAENRSADLIVVGSTHVEALRWLAIGRVVERVIEHAGCPVLVVWHRQVGARR